MASETDDNKYRGHVFGELVPFLAQFNPIYDFKVTEFFSQRIWEKIPSEWLPYLIELSAEELNEIPFGLTKPNWPQSLLSFLTNAIRFSSISSVKRNTIQPIKVEEIYRHGMSPKKLHEVSYLIAVIDDICCRHFCKRIVDVGSGLGYLDLVLSRQLGYEVLGLENKKERVCGAGDRVDHAEDKQDKDFASNRFISKHFELKNSSESILELESLIEEMWPSESDSSDVCLIGLHCCGDLTPATIKAFSSLRRARCVICISCCYHRMRTTENGFLHFPLSMELRRTIAETKNISPFRNWCFSKYAFRLAAQETNSRWRKQSEEDHSSHVRSVAYRGLFELNGKLSFMKLKRTLVRKKGYNDFDSYVDEVIKRTSLHDSTAVKDHLVELYRDYEKYFAFIEPITMLQVMLQPVLELVIIMDRVEYLQEQGFSADILSVFDDLISPRNHALIASKDATNLENLL